MMIRKKKRESGQVLVLLVLAVVGLMGFAALAIDGGMAYADRRQAQNSADAASLAGGSAAALWMEQYGITFENFNCKIFNEWKNNDNKTGKELAEDAAIDRAGSNQFIIESGLHNHHGVEVTCVNFFNGAFYERYIDVTVEITSETNTALVHLVYDGPTKNQVAAVTRIRPHAPLGFGQAIIGLNDQGCDGNNNGVIIHGSTDININGGGIFSAGCLRFMGAQSVNVNVNPPVFSYVEELSMSGNVNLNGSPNQVPSGIMPEDYLYVPAPDCDQVPHYGNPSNAYNNNAGGHIPPGNYTRIKFNSAGSLQGGGLYCMNGDFDVGNNDLSIEPSDDGKLGVTIYLISGNFITGGNGEVNLSAPPSNPDPYPAIPGVLIFLAEGNTGLVSLAGNSVSSFEGTIYAPSGTIEAYGTPGHEATFFTQFIGKNVKVGGNARIDVNYQGGKVFRIPTLLNLHQ
ncbi:MAG: Tad domain-containing protein [Anaerolineales bacterium]|nr:Tad domain-containing protein [Anaerolineales bacterium]